MTTELVAALVRLTYALSAAVLLRPYRLFARPASRGYPWPCSCGEREP
ncbi:hypothetical protein [Archangium violaceum]